MMHNLALKPAADREAAQARLLACRLRQKLDKMSEPMRGLVAADLNSGAVK